MHFLSTNLVILCLFNDQKQLLTVEMCDKHQNNLILNVFLLLKDLKIHQKFPVLQMKQRYVEQNMKIQG